MSFNNNYINIIKLINYDYSSINWENRLYIYTKDDDPKHA